MKLDHLGKALHGPRCNVEAAALLVALKKKIIITHAIGENFEVEQGMQNEIGASIWRDGEHRHIEGGRSSVRWQIRPLLLALILLENVPFGAVVIASIEKGKIADKSEHRLFWDSIKQVR